MAAVRHDLHRIRLPIEIGIAQMTDAPADALSRDWRICRRLRRAERCARHRRTCRESQSARYSLASRDRRHGFLPIVMARLDRAIQSPRVGAANNSWG